MLPQGLLGHLCRALANGFHFGIALARETDNGILDGIGHLEVVVVGAVYHFYPIVDAVLFFRPFTQMPKPAKSVVMVGTLKATLSNGV